MEPEVKKEHKYLPVLITVLVMLIVVALVGGGVWYYMDQQAKKASDENGKQVAELQKQVSTLNSSKNVTAADSSKKDLASKTEIQKFCLEGQAGNVVRSYSYLVNENGQYSKCNVGLNDGPGWMVIGKVAGGNWQKVYSGQQVMSFDAANQNKVPRSLLGEDITTAAQVYSGYNNYQY
jgi:hypothetical protein